MELGQLSDSPLDNLARGVDTKILGNFARGVPKRGKSDFLWHHTLCVMRIIFASILVLVVVVYYADWKRLHQSGDLTKNFNLYRYSHEAGISRESFAQSGYHLPPFCCLHLESLPGAMIECTALQSILASIILQYSLFQPVWYSAKKYPSGTCHVLSVAGWSCMAEWYTLWGQEFLANWNLLLVTGPSEPPTSTASCVVSTIMQCAWDVNYSSCVVAVSCFRRSCKYKKGHDLSWCIQTSTKSVYKSSELVDQRKLCRQCIWTVARSSL